MNKPKTLGIKMEKGSVRGCHHSLKVTMDIPAALASSGVATAPSSFAGNIS